MLPLLQGHFKPARQIRLLRQRWRSQPGCSSDVSAIDLVADHGQLPLSEFCYAKAATTPCPEDEASISLRTARRSISFATGLRTVMAMQPVTVVARPASLIKCSMPEPGSTPTAHLFVGVRSRGSQPKGPQICRPCPESIRDIVRPEPSRARQVSPDTRSTLASDAVIATNCEIAALSTR